MVEKFADKEADDFFRSETAFIERIAAETRSVLDVGCASGRLIQLLDVHLAPGFEFTGIDLVADSIERARARYPTHEFMLGDLLAIDPPGRYDLVNATGVVQHEPRFRDLIERMSELSRRWVLFDAKVADLTEDVSDLARAYVEIGNDRLYFNILAFGPFLDRLTNTTGVARVDVLAYETPLNARTTVEAGIGPIASAGFLIELVADASTETEEGARAGVAVHTDVPAFLAG